MYVFPCSFKSVLHFFKSKVVVFGAKWDKLSVWLKSLLRHLFHSFFDNQVSSFLRLLGYFAPMQGRTSSSVVSLLHLNSLLTVYLLVCLINTLRSLINELAGIIFEIVGFTSDKAIAGLSFIIGRRCIPDLSYSRCLFKNRSLCYSIEASCVVANEFVAIWVRTTKPLLSVRLLSFIGLPTWLLCFVILVMGVVVWLILVDVSYPTVVCDYIDLIFSTTHWGWIILRLAPRVRSALLLIFRTSLCIKWCIGLRFQQHCWICLLVNKLVVANVVILWTNIFISTGCQRCALERVFFLLEGDCLPMLCEVRFKAEFFCFVSSCRILISWNIHFFWNIFDLKLRSVFRSMFLMFSDALLLGLLLEVLSVSAFTLDIRLFNWAAISEMLLLFPFLSFQFRLAIISVTYLLFLLRSNLSLFAFSRRIFSRRMRSKSCIWTITNAMAARALSNFLFTFLSRFFRFERFLFF